MSVVMRALSPILLSCLLLIAAKASTFGRGSKANHLSYVGDS